MKLLIYRTVLIFVLSLLGCFSFAQDRAPLTFYLDSQSGNDLATGQSAESAWKTIRRLDREKLVPGDQVLFKRGGLWRESLKPKSGAEGAPIIYDAYGQGERPILQASTSRDRPEDWQSCGENLWTTVTSKPVVQEKIAVSFSDPWHIHHEEPAQLQWKNLLSHENSEGQAKDTKKLELTIQAGGARPTNIQLVGPKLSCEGISGPVLFRFRARSSKGFEIPEILIRHPGPPWNDLFRTTKSISVGPAWQEYQLLLFPTGSGGTGQVVLYIGQAVPNDTVFEWEPLSLHQASFPEGHEPLGLDIGNIIFDHGRTIGFKRWGLNELKEEADFWYDPEGRRVVLYCSVHPTQAAESIELCLKRHVIDHGGVHDCVIRHLALRYGAAHGIGGQGARRVHVEDCDIYYIGGGHLYTRNNQPTRYGNGIEWWCSGADCLVQRCRFWEIYDVALSPQGNAEESVIENITIRDCLIRNCEQSFEYWRTGEGSETRNIRFEHNTCVNAGYGWSHRQRPDKRGTHFLSYNVTVPTEIILCNNIFYRGKNDLISTFSEWRNGMKLHNNLWWQEEDAVFLSHRGQCVYRTGDFQKYIDEYSVEQNSLFARPEFMDPSSHDYRLQPNSPGSTLSTTGGPVGMHSK